MVAYLDPHLMQIFRRKMANPAVFSKAYGIIRQYRYADLCKPDGAYGLVDGLSSCLNVEITPEQRENAANWLMNCGIDPDNRPNRYRMWNFIRGWWII